MEINKYAGKKIKALREKHNLTQQQLAEKLNINQQNLARYELDQRTIKVDFLLKLCKLFNVELNYFVPNNVIPIELEKNVAKIPVLGYIPAGKPIEAIEDVLFYEEIPKDWLKGNNKYFGLKIQGNSMSPKYLDGDIVIFKQTSICNNGDDCAVMVDGENATFKKILITGYGLTLQPLNSEYTIQMFSRKEVEELPVRILGVAKELRRKF